MLSLRGEPTMKARLAKIRPLLSFALILVLGSLPAFAQSAEKGESEEKSAIEYVERYAGELLQFSKKVLPAEKFYETRSHLELFGGEAGQDEYFMLYARLLKKENERKVLGQTAEIAEIRKNLNEIYRGINRMFGIVIGGGTYFGHEHARIVALTEYDIFRYLNDRKMRESFKKALIMTDKDKEDFESSFWTVASTWRRDYDEGYSGYWFTEDGYMGVCNDMYEIKTELLRLENAFTNYFYRERAENYIGDIMRGFLREEEDTQ